MRHHLTAGEDENPREIELADDPSILSPSTTGNALKSCCSNNAPSSRIVVWRFTVTTERVINPNDDCESNHIIGALRNQHHGIALNAIQVVPAAHYQPTHKRSMCQDERLMDASKSKANAV